MKVKDLIASVILFTLLALFVGFVVLLVLADLMEGTT